jgi:hypothetical protein
MAVASCKSGSPGRGGVAINLTESFVGRVVFTLLEPYLTFHNSGVLEIEQSAIPPKIT